MAIPAVALALINMAPALLRLFGKNAPAEIADKAVSVAKIITGTDTPEKAVEVLQADPAKMLEYQNAVEERALNWAKLYIEDTQNARIRDVELAKAGFKNTRANWLAASAYATVIICLWVVLMQSDLNEYAKGIITLILGRALGWVEQIFSFEFGTTKSSKQKDDTIQSLSKE